MKRIIIMLLIACSAITTVSADPSAAPQKKPESVIATLNAIINKFGENEGQVYSVNRNPNTGIIESSTRIVPFRCLAISDQNDFTQQNIAASNDILLSSVARNFPKDEPLSYQILHIQPNSKENFSLKVITNNGMDNKTLRLRSFYDQEMWLMCCKNPENPQLRDAYAIVWALSADKRYIEGTVYMITSLRPDMYEKSMSNTFKIDGRVGDDLNDSLYVVYMADTAEELNNVDDDAFVATMPVVNKRFNFSVEIDKPMVGRIRTVMPDGSLCKLWTNLDFVPGETYHITTHNGWYEEDIYYENRVGRRSGNSLLNDLQRRGIDDLTVVVADTIPAEYQKATAVQPQDWRNSLTAQQQAQIQLKAELVQMEIEKIKASYKAIGEELQGMRDLYKIDTIYETILKQNKELDKKYQEVIKLVKGYAIPAAEMPELYKEILKFYNEQKQGVNELFKSFGYSREAKFARNLNKYLNNQMEKYIKEMENSLE